MAEISNLTSQLLSWCKGDSVDKDGQCCIQFYLLLIYLQYIPRNMHTVFALLNFAVVIHWLILPYPSGLLHWHCGNQVIAPVPAKQPWWIWINSPCEFIMSDCITTTKQNTTKPCAYFLVYTVLQHCLADIIIYSLVIKFSFVMIACWVDAWTGIIIANGHLT